MLRTLVRTADRKLDCAVRTGSTGTEEFRHILKELYVSVQVFKMTCTFYTTRAFMCIYIYICINKRTYVYMYICVYMNGFTGVGCGVWGFGVLRSRLKFRA